ncbi:MAG: response regulator [Chloroflexi bacterium]|nr:response regulator [Chloroflexota bacterium]
MPPLSNSADTKATILIVDDNTDNRLLLASQLSMHGYQILEASNGQEGLNITQEKKPDLVLLDVMMPMMNGFEVCSILKANPETVSIPVIIITSLRDVEYRIQGIKAGADEFLSRPHNREELLVRVRSLIRLKQARDKLEEERNRLQLLYNVSRAITNTQLDVDEMMSQILTHTQAAVGATKGSLMLVDNTGTVTHKILIRAGLLPEMTEYVTPEVMLHGLAGWLVNHKRGDIIENTSQDERWVTLPDDVEQVGSAIGVPLMKSGTIVGVLILIHQQAGYFRAEHLQLLETIAGQVTVAIHNAYLFTEVSEQQRKLGAILAQSTDAIIATEQTGHLVLFNHAAERFFDLHAADVLDQPLTAVEPLQPLAGLLERAQETAVTEEVGLADGRILFASVTPISEVGHMAVMQDVTEMKRMEQMRLAQERREKQILKDTFSRYMSPRLVEQVLSNEMSLFGQRQRRRAVVMFADLRGFTRMIVGLEPNASITVLNEFFTEMTEVVYEFDGTIFDLAGDELMVGFNVPFDQSDAAYRAVQTGVSMQRRFDELRHGWFQRTNIDLGLGIGIDAGDVVMGNVGAETRMNFAMVGEAVNTAHRLVDIAQDGQIVVSDWVHDEVETKTGLNGVLGLFDSMGEVALKGKLAPQLLYRATLARTPLGE